jgi:hypothetical protein
MEASMATNTVAFISYTHVDDKYEDGAIAKLARRLENALRKFTGMRDLAIFFDRDSIAWGDAWKVRIAQGLADSMFLIPIVTPSYLTSDQCQEEVEQFCRLTGSERHLLPIYYIEIPNLETRSDPISIAVRGNQHVDWRQLRTVGQKTLGVMKAIEKLAKEICTRLEQKTSAQDSSVPHSEVASDYRVQMMDPADTTNEPIDYALWAQTALDDEDYGLARAILLGAMEQVSDPAFVYLLATVDWYYGALDDAVAEFEQARTEGVDEIVVLQGLGQARIERGDFEQGIADLDEVLKHHHDADARAYARSSRALGLAGLGRFKEALNELAATEKLTPGNAWLHFNRARVLDWQQDKAAAQSYIRSLILRDPPLNRPKREFAQRRLQDLETLS